MRVNVNKRNIGINVRDNGEVDIAVWAPLAERVDIVTEQNKILLQKGVHGYWNY